MGGGPYRGKLRDFIKDCLLNVKPEGDEVLAMVTHDSEEDVRKILTGG